MSKIIIKDFKIRLENDKTTVQIDFETKEKFEEVFGTTIPSEKEIKEYLKKD
jgi:hypothetical protein